MLAVTEFEFPPSDHLLVTPPPSDHLLEPTPPYDHLLVFDHPVDPEEVVELE